MGAYGADSYSDAESAHDASFLKSIALGDYEGSYLGSTLKSHAMLAAVNPGVGIGLWNPAGLITNIPAIKGRLPQWANKSLSPLVRGHFVLGDKSTTDAAKAYWKLHNLEGTSIGRHYMARKWTDRALTAGDWLIDRETLASNRLIGGMIAHEMKLGSAEALAKGAGRWAAWKAGASAASKLAGRTSVALHVAGRFAGPIGVGLWIYDAARAGVTLTKALDRVAQAGNERLNRPQLSSFLVNSMQAQTERRRALQVIQQSRLNARSAFGHEARRVHQ